MLKKMSELTINFNPHFKENNSESESTLHAQFERLKGNNKKLYEALMRGERLTGAIIVSRYGMLEYRRRIKDLKAAGLDVKEVTLKGGVKEWWV